MKEAIILAGGFGTRLQHVVSDVPKPMAPIRDIPFLSYLFDYLLQYGFSHIVLSTGYLHQKIEDYYGCRYKTLSLDYARETTPLGTGGGILNALQKCLYDDVVVLNGDTFFAVDYHQFFEFYREKKTSLAVLLRQVEDVSRYGCVALDDNQRICSFQEKNVATGKGLINGGIYLLNKCLFHHFTLGEKFSFEKDLMELDYKNHDFYGSPSDGYFIDIGIPEDYARAQQEL